MRKIIFLMAIISVLILAGCKFNKDNEVVDGGKTNIPNEQIEAIKEISLKYTGYEELKAQNLIPQNPISGELYDVGKLKIADKEYDLKYILINDIIDLGDTKEEYAKETLKFYSGDVVMLDLCINTTNPTIDYVKEITIFKDKYLVTVTDTKTKDTLQSLKIYSEYLKTEKIDYLDNYEDTVYVSENGRLYLNNAYENYYVVNDNEIIYIRTEGEEKVTLNLSEVEKGLKIKVVEKTAEGVLPYTGRTFKEGK